MCKALPWLIVRHPSLSISVWIGCLFYFNFLCLLITYDCQIDCQIDCQTDYQTDCQTDCIVLIICLKDYVLYIGFLFWQFIDNLEKIIL